MIAQLCSEVWASLSKPVLTQVLFFVFFLLLVCPGMFVCLSRLLQHFRVHEIGVETEFAKVMSINAKCFVFTLVRITCVVLGTGAHLSSVVPKNAVGHMRLHILVQNVRHESCIGALFNLLFVT